MPIDFNVANTWIKNGFCCSRASAYKPLFALALMALHLIIQTAPILGLCEVRPYLIKQIVGLTEAAGD